MVRAKTIKKTDDASSKKKSEVREYSVTDTFDKGDMVFHKVWDDTGEVIEVGTTDDGINKMKVAFEKVGIKTLRMA
jgi:transcription elongation factor GreA-like protein